MRWQYVLRFVLGIASKGMCFAFCLVRETEREYYRAPQLFQNEWSVKNRTKKNLGQVRVILQCLECKLYFQRVEAPTLAAEGARKD